MQIEVDGAPLDAREGDDVLTALARRGRLPGGCLCMGGDCPNCLATIDGVAYVRMCQTIVKPGMTVEPFAVADHPPMVEHPTGRGQARRFEHADAVVVGAGDSGTSELERLTTAGHRVILLDVGAGGEVLAVYEGPEVVARIDGEIVRMHADEVVVATGAAEIHPVAPGSHLAGILTPTAAARFHAAGVDLGRVVAVAGPIPGVECPIVAGTVVRFEGASHVEAVVVRAEDGTESTHVCDTVAVDLGTYPRDLLVRMGGERVRAVGGAASEPTLPACPPAGVICPCSGVTVDDLVSVWERGFEELELIKRATLAGTGTCQGGVCTPYLRSFVAQRGGELQETFTARPPARQLTMAEAAAGQRLPPIQRTALDGVHRALGARMDRMGGWWRPWTYGDADGEYRSVRTAVSLGDVGTLGKITVSGPDAAEFLERIYPCRVADLAPGRSRYALVLAESGGVMDDGLIARIDQTTFGLTFTSAGASVAEAWLRDWALTFGVDVRIMDRTAALGAINVTGPKATLLLERAGLTEPLRFMRHIGAVVAGVPSRVFRLSFTGEVSYELHHRPSKSAELWSELMRLGEDIGIRPHGLETLQRLRLEKGHIIIGMDTEPDSTPRRLGMEWAVAADKGDFVGKPALERTNRRPLDRLLVGLSMEGDPPVDGAPTYVDGEINGYVTSAAWSPTLEKSVMLAWAHLSDGRVPDSVTVDGRVARRTPTPFYDPEGHRARG